MKPFSTFITNLAILVIVFLGTFSTQSHAELPNLSSTKDERSLSNPSYVIGQHWFRQINSSQAVIAFPPAYNYVRQALSTIVPHTSLDNKMIEITLLNSTQSNAFVIPGNHLFIYSDIMEMITNEDMFYALLSHEVAHLDLNHYERQSQFSSQELSKTLIMIGASLAAAAAGAGSDATSALWIGGMANQAENTLTHSREQEQEADRQGRRYMKAAGLNPQGMNHLFKAMFKASLGRPRLEFLSTHPLPKTRIADSMSFQKEDSILRQKESSRDFLFFRATMLAYRAILSNRVDYALLQSIPNEDAYNFAQALVAYLQQSPQKALTFLAKVHTHNRFVSYLKALSLQSDGQKKAALKVVEGVLNLAPNDLSFGTLYATFTHTKYRGVEVPRYLYEKKQVWEADITYYRDRQNIPIALNYKALLDFSLGQDKEAQRLLFRALQDAKDTDKPLIKRTQDEIDRIKEAEKEEGIRDD
ncbi:TPR repeat-containing protein YfgC precursor [Marinomonas spartinae]|uniref:M48 family metalloprotease n=1 Tax=Marinomonas spartinae TaxID=1792290 RepID=UPI000808B568|nr:M48 family metalloprotease [Marinomonas spartinae]SBS37464.1 TPR repeat-containing protein YfgC precursor [Marinomonas spartinae]